MLKYVLCFAAGFLITISSFSQQTVGLFKYDSLAQDGYTLFAPYYNKNTFLVNNCGHLVQSWSSNYNPGAAAYLTPDGHMIRAAHVPNMRFDEGGGNGGRIEEYDWDGNLVWYINLSTDSFSQHHDFKVMPNGNILVLMWEFVPRDEAIDAGKMLNESQNGIWQESIWELKPKPVSGATVVWKWNFMDHVIQEYDQTKQNFGPVANHPELIDLNCPLLTPGVDMLHFNSIDYNPDLDQILISCRSLSELYIIDHSTTTAESAGHIGGDQNRGGDILYRYGNPAAYQQGDVNDQVSYYQHDAQWIPKGYPNAGKVVFFNNGGTMNRNYSSIDVFKTPVDENGTYPVITNSAYGPSKSEWSYTAPVKGNFYSNIMGGVTPLPNGNFMICESVSGDLFEITPTKKIVWDYVNPVNSFGPVKQGRNPFGNSVFRSVKYASGHPAFKDRELEDGLPLESEPLPILCDDTTSTGGSDTTGGEDTTTTIARYKLQDDLLVYPDPFVSGVSVKTSGSGHSILVINSMGQVVFQAENQPATLELSLQDLEAGVYTLFVIKEAGTAIHTRRLMKL